MAIIKRNREYSPISSMLSDFFDADKFFNLDMVNPEKGILRNIPAVNIKDLDGKYEIELAVPGFDKKDFQIAVEDNILKISAERKEEKSEKKENYTRQEFNYSSFERSFVIPENATEENIQAEYKDGILMLSLLKKQEAQVKKRKDIEVK